MALLIILSTTMTILMKFFYYFQLKNREALGKERVLAEIIHEWRALINAIDSYAE